MLMLLIWLSVACLVQANMGNFSSDLSDLSSKHWSSKRVVKVSCNGNDWALIRSQLIGLGIILLEGGNKLATSRKMWVESRGIMSKYMERPDRAANTYDPTIWKRVAVLNAYKTFYDGSLFEATSRPDPERDGRRMNELVDRARTLTRGMRSLVPHKKIEILCGDTWLEKVNSEDEPLADVDQCYFDRRWAPNFDTKLSPDDPQRAWVTMPQGRFSGDIESPVGYAFCSMPGPYPTVLAINPFHLPMLNRTRAIIPGIRSGNINQLPQLLKDKPLSKLASNSLVINLLELLGREAIFKDNPLVDGPCIDRSKYASAWDCVVDTAKAEDGVSTPSMMNNIHAFKYFFLALYLQDYDWTSGYGQKLENMPYTSLEHPPGSNTHVHINSPAKRLFNFNVALDADGPSKDSWDASDDWESDHY